MKTLRERAERRRWAEPTTLADLAETNARWIEGEFTSRPGRAHRRGPGGGPTPVMREALVAVNRAGCFTGAAQPGLFHNELAGTFLAQHAAVDGFTDDATAARIAALAASNGLLAVTGRARRWRRDDRQVRNVTFRDGVPITGFGSILSRRLIRDGWVGYGMCSRQAQAALCDAVQFTVIDPLVGCDVRLWRVLLDAVTGGRDPR